MADIKGGRWTAEIEGDFVVFIIGARLNSKWQVFKSFADPGGRRGMNHMLKYLAAHSEKGLLGYEAIYGNMPAHGLGKASRLVPVAESVGAGQRLKRRLAACPDPSWEAITYHRHSDNRQNVGAFRG